MAYTYYNKLCIDNDISFEFYSFDLCVKDMVSNEIKLQAPNSHSLYKVETCVHFGILSKCVPVGYHAYLDT